LRLDQEMNVVWHQAIGVEIEGKFGFLLLEQDSEPDVIIVGPEDFTTIIPASNQVIERSADFRSLVSSAWRGR
jgi:hypothetical protein